MTIVVDVLPPIKPPLLKPGALDRMAIEQSGTMRQRKTDAPPAPLLLLLSLSLKTTAVGVQTLNASNFGFTVDTTGGKLGLTII